MQLTPLVAIHMTAALAALALGPFAIWARKGAVQRPRLHRALGYSWVALMLATALSAVFIKNQVGPSLGGFGLIHLLIPVTLASLVAAFWFLAKGNIVGHRKTMVSLYISGCLIAGFFTFMPGRYLNGVLRSVLGFA